MVTGLLDCGHGINSTFALTIKLIKITTYGQKKVLVIIVPIKRAVSLLRNNRVAGTG